MNSLSLQITLVTAEAINLQLSPFGADLVCNYQAICSLLRVLDLPVGSMILYPTLGVQFAPLHPRQQDHPGEDLRQREGQAEAVREIVIATRPAF
jgi:hypothetical protein